MPQIPYVQAFPSSREYAIAETITKHEEEGMSLRDYFAGQVLISLAPKSEIWQSDVIADVCYTLADAMMEARSK